MAEAPVARDPAGLLPGAVAAACIGLLGYNTLPLLIGAVMDSLAFDATRAGALGSLEIGAMAVAGLGVAPVVHRVSLPRLALAAASIVALAHAGSGLAASFGVLAVLRACAGLAGGCVNAAANAAVAGSLDPDRLYAKVTFLSALLAAALFAAMPLAIERWALLGAFGTLAAVAAAGLPVVASLPERRRVARPAGPEGSAAVLVRPSSVLLLGAAFVLAVGENALWAFTERVAHGVGLPGEQIGLALAVTTVVGTIGALAAAWMGVRFGRTVPLALGLIAIGFASLVIARATSGSEWIAAQLAYNTLYLFLTPFFLGTAAALDPAGRIPAAVGGITMVGGALGPTAGGAIVDWGGFGGLGVFVLGCCLLPVLALAPVTLPLDRRAGSASPVATP